MTKYIAEGQAWYIASYAANTGNIEQAKKLLDAAPAADVAPIARGEWVAQPPDKGDCMYRCSCCGFIRDAYVLDVDAYCPNCGARMGGIK